MKNRTLFVLLRTFVLAFGFCVLLPVFSVGIVAQDASAVTKNYALEEKVTANNAYTATNAVAPSTEFAPFVQTEYVDAKLVSVGSDGELIYMDYDGKGGKILDYSCVGYKNSNEPIPNVKVVKTVEAGDLKDHTALIQGAIDEISALPLEQRGAILLKAGKYTVSDNLQISASGIVLRGEGQGENGTVIYDSRKEKTLPP